MVGSIQTGLSSSTRTRWPCTYCVSTYHFPDRCPRCPFRPSQQDFSIGTSQQGEILDQVLQPAEISTTALATATLVTTRMTVTSVVPHLILSVDATGSHLHPTELSGPGSRTPYDRSL